MTGEPAVARNLGAETTLSARSRVSGAAEESIIQISATDSSSSNAWRWVQQSLLHARHADTHTRPGCFSQCLTTLVWEPTLMSESQELKIRNIYTLSRHRQAYARAYTHIHTQTRAHRHTYTLAASFSKLFETKRSPVVASSKSPEGISQEPGAN